MLKFIFSFYILLAIVKIDVKCRNMKKTKKTKKQNNNNKKNKQKKTKKNSPLVSHGRCIVFMIVLYTSVYVKRIAVS